MNRLHGRALAGDKVFFIVGPTCVGKTAVAQWIAEHYDFDILSADSMLVYKGMDIGTAKPSVLERSRARYRGIDLVSAQERFSVGMYRKAAVRAIASACSKGRAVIVVGGTGLYIRSLIDGLTAREPGDMSIRSEAEDVLRSGGVKALQRWLEAENSALYKSLPDKKNPRRLVRALELSRAGGAPHGARWRNADAGPRIAGLKLPPEQHRRRIEKRVREMFSNGLLQETENLLSRGFDAAPTARQAIGYAEAVDYIKGRCSLENAIEGTIVRTRQLAKKQHTWFRHQANVHWLECDESMTVAQISDMVLEHWRSSGPVPISR